MEGQSHQLEDKTTHPTRTDEKHHQGKENEVDQESITNVAVR